MDAVVVVPLGGQQAGSLRVGRGQGGILAVGVVLVGGGVGPVGGARGGARPSSPARAAAQAARPAKPVGAGLRGRGRRRRGGSCRRVGIRDEGGHAGACLGGAGPLRFGGVSRGRRGRGRGHGRHPLGWHAAAELLHDRVRPVQELGEAGVLGGDGQADVCAVVRTLEGGDAGSSFAPQAPGRPAVPGARAAVAGGPPLGERGGRGAEVVAQGRHGLIIQGSPQVERALFDGESHAGGLQAGCVGRASASGRRARAAPGRHGRLGRRRRRRGRRPAGLLPTARPGFLLGVRGRGRFHLGFRRDDGRRVRRAQRLSQVARPRPPPARPLRQDGARIGRRHLGRLGEPILSQGRRAHGRLARGQLQGFVPDEQGQAEVLGFLGVEREGLRKGIGPYLFVARAPLPLLYPPSLTSGSLSVCRPSSAAARAIRDLARSSTARRVAAMSSGVSGGAGGGRPCATALSVRVGRGGGRAEGA